MNEEVFPCPCCQVGYCQPGKGTYLRMIGRTLVSAPDMPAWTCDVCNYQEFDRDAVVRLEMLLGQSDELSGEAPRSNAKLSALESAESLTPRRAKP